MLQFLRHLRTIRRGRNLRIRQVVDQILAQPVPNPEAGTDACLQRYAPSDFRSDFSSNNTWNQIRCHKIKQRWSRLIWFSQNIPRFAFISWLAIKNRLSTGGRTRGWGLVQHCRLCGEPNETRDHLFFACPYSFMVWLDVVGSLLEVPPTPDWNDTLEHIITHSFDKDKYILVRLVLQSTIYHLWKERNERKHKGTQQTTTSLVRVIDKTIRNRVSSLRQGGEPRYELLLQKWFQTRTYL